MAPASSSENPAIRAILSSRRAIAISTDHKFPVKLGQSAIVHCAVNAPDGMLGQQGYFLCSICTSSVSDSP